MNNPSIRIIAQKANVSVSTVSRALSSVESVRKKVKPQTLKLVSTIAEHEGYTPNANARSLITKQTKTIGFVVTSAGDPFWARMLEIAEQELRKVRWNLFIGYSHNDAECELEVIKSFLEQRVDGIILSASKINTNSSHFEKLIKGKAKILMFDRQGQGMSKQFQYVGIDNQLGGQLAARHLIELGHKGIAYVGLRDRPRSNKRRCRGFLSALKKAKIQHCEDFILACEIGNQPMEAGVDLGKQIAIKLAPQIRSREITGIVCFNDILAIGFLLGCRDLEISVPKDCSIVGFDDLMICEFTSPTLTTIRQPREKMASYAIRLLLNSINPKDLRIRNYLSQFSLDNQQSFAFMPPQLIARGSTSIPI